MKNKFLLFLSIGVLSFASCQKTLDVQNENQPDFEKVYASGDDVYNVASGLFNSYYNGAVSVNGMGPMLQVAADNVSCSWGNFAMRDMSWEPRKEWNNAPNYSYQDNTKYTFDKMYSVINTASNVIKAMNSGVKIGVNGADDNLVKAFSRFNMGIAHGVLALNYDKAFIVDEKITIPGAKLSDAKAYSLVSAAAVGYLKEAITLCSSSFAIPTTWMSTAAPVSNTTLAQMANSYIARILSNTPRNATENAAVNWAAVKTHADAGITSDFMVINDAYNRWYNSVGDYMSYPGWGVVDMYVVNKLDPNIAPHWTDDPKFPTPKHSTNPNADKRINTDFEPINSNWLQAARGYYHWSIYRYKRYDDIYALGEGPAPEMLKAENDLYRAEARAWTGDLAGAAAVINAGTRKTRGGLADVTGSLTAIKDAINAERHVELYLSGMGLQFYEMRKNDLLQKGTPLHLPVPAKTLETLAVSLPFYTHGGPTRTDGVNTSNKGWR